MVLLLVTNLGNPHINGFVLAGVMDTVVVLWTLGYWWEQKRATDAAMAIR